MTDEKMRQLEALAHAVLDGRENVGELYDHLSASDVLALIERARNAERKGAEEMRERAATVHDGQCASQGFSGLSTAPWHRRYAAEIRGLPLPGDPP